MKTKYYLDERDGWKEYTYASETTDFELSVSDKFAELEIKEHSFKTSILITREELENLQAMIAEALDNER